MLHKSAAFSGVLSHSCPTRRATRSVVLSHKISTPPACWPGESKLSSGQLSTQSSAKNTVESRNARCWCASCPRGKKEERQGSDLTVCSMGADYPKNPWEQWKKRYLGNENYRGLYWRDPTVNSCPKERPPGSPRTFSTVPCPRTSSLRAKQDRSCPFPFSIPPLSFVPIESKAKQKWLPTLPTWRKGTNFVSFPGLWIGFSQRYDIIKRKEWSFGYRRTLPKPLRVSGCFLDWSSLSSPERISKSSAYLW